MPIRMVDDNDSDRYVPSDRGGGNIGGGGGGGGCLTLALPLLFNLFRRNPKLALIIGAIVLIGYFAMQMGGGGGGGTSDVVQPTNLSTGAEMKQEVYDKADVFASLDPTKNQLPTKVSLLQYAPPRKNQGEQGSCVAWASTYSARSIMESAANGSNPASTAFSPSHVYNQIHLPNCQGAYIPEAMKLMQKQGCVPYNQFPYNDQECNTRPNSTIITEAQQYRIRGYNRLSKDGNNYAPDLLAIKQNLAKGAPVVIGMMVGGSFMEGMFGRDMWSPTRSDYNMSGFGGHAMCVIGYDDNMQGGAFQIMNSWGPEWGNNGVGWVRYKDFEHFTKEAYGLDPLPKRGSADATKFSVALGLVTNQNSQYIPMKATGKNQFSSGMIAKGTKFKMEITNNIPCYTYVIGFETDNKSYVLFPYSEKHSPYCGITGTRLFPKTESMLADEVGNKDYIAVIVSKTELDYNALNASINNSRQATPAAKLSEALGSNQVQNVNFQSNELIKLEADAKDKNTIGMIIEINKR